MVGYKVWKRRSDWYLDDNKFEGTEKQHDKEEKKKSKNKDNIVIEKND